MGIDLAEIFRPGVDMRIEMDERRRAALLGERAEQRKRDTVLAAERDLQLRRLNYRRDTLEDIFLKAMEN